jgi:hypothetical protein
VPSEELAQEANSSSISHVAVLTVTAWACTGHRKKKLPRQAMQAVSNKDARILDLTIMTWTREAGPLVSLVKLESEPLYPFHIIQQMAASTAFAVGE